MTTQEREIMDEMRMDIIGVLEEVSGDIWCDCKPVNQAVNKAFDFVYQKGLEEGRREVVEEAVKIVESFEISGGLLESTEMILEGTKAILAKQISSLTSPLEDKKE